MREGEITKQRLSPASLIGLFVVVALGASITTYFFQRLSENAPVDVVVLKAENTQFKVAPEEPVKQKDAGTNSSVMNMLDELNASKDDMEVLSLKPDAPEMPEITVEAQESSQGEDAAVTKEATDKSKDVREEATDSEIASNTQSGAEADKEVTTEQKTDIDQKIDEMLTASNSASDSTKTDEDSVVPRPVERPIRPLVIENPVANGPSMMVQLAAFRNQEKAEEVAALLTQKHKERLQGLTLGIMQADTGSSGIFWRVTTEPLPTEDARNLCDALKRAGQDCIFRKVAMPQ